MQILLIGGSGFVGSALATELGVRGHTVTVLSRTPNDDPVPDDVRTVAGDVTDYDSIESAFEGQDAVVNLVALSPLFIPAGGSEMHERVHLDGTKHVVEAAQTHGVERLVQLSALGADPDGPTAYIRAKGAAERVVQDSSLAWTIVRPSVVFGDGGEFIPFTKTLTTPYVTGLPGGGQTRFQPLWVGDLAPMLAAMVDDAQHVGETYELGGPDVLTLAEVATLAYRADGTSLTVLPIPMPLARLGMTLAGVLPGIPIGVDQYRSLTFDTTVGDTDVDAFDRSPSELHTLTAYLGVPDRDAATDDGTTSPATDGGGSSQARTSTGTAVLAGVAAWAVVMGTVLASGLVTDVWTLGDIPARAGDILPSFGVLLLGSTVLLVGGPVTLYLQTNLVTPLIGLLLYFGVWVAYGAMSGFGAVRSLYIAFLYGMFAIAGMVVVGGLEYAIRIGGHSDPSG